MKFEEEVFINRTFQNLYSQKYPQWFREWIDENWSIWENFAKRAVQMAETGKTHYSARVIVEVLRWETDLREGNSVFKITNNATPWMAKLFMDVNPSLDGFFRTHKKESALGRLFQSHGDVA